MFPLALGRRREKWAFVILRALERPPNGLRQSSKWPHGGRMDQQPFLGTQGKKGSQIQVSEDHGENNGSFVMPLMGKHFHWPPASNSQHPCWVIRRMKYFKQLLHPQGLMQARAIRSNTHVTRLRRGFLPPSHLHSNDSILKFKKKKRKKSRAWDICDLK